MKLTLKIARPPVIQIALDYATIEEALEMARLGIEAGVDWLEIGTPLIVAQGVAPIGKMVRAFPDYPVLADYKTMDSGWKNVQRTADQGGHIMTVCANSPDETVRSAIAESKNSGVWVVADTIGVKDQPSRARQCADWGVHMIYLHYGADQRKSDATQDSTQWLAAGRLDSDRRRLLSGRRRRSRRSTRGRTNRHRTSGHQRRRSAQGAEPFRARSEGRISSAHTLALSHGVLAASRHVLPLPEMRKSRYDHRPSGARSPNGAALWK